MIFHKTSAALAALVLAAGVLTAAAGSARAEPGFTGMQIQGMHPAFADALDLDRAAGVLVRDVLLGGPADKAGVRRGDLITSFDGAPVNTVGNLASMVSETSPGGTHTVTVRRANGDEAALTLNIAQRPESWTIENKATGVIPDHGLTMVTLTQQMRNNMAVRWGVNGVGVTVVEDPSDPGFKTDMKRGEVIVQVNQSDVWLPEQVIDAYRGAKAQGRKSVMLLVNGLAGFRFSVLTIPQN